MRIQCLGLLAALCLFVPAQAEETPPVAASTYRFTLEDGNLSGPGAEVIRRGTAGAQFVLFGEDHHDHDSPLFAAALYRMLRDEQGIDHLVVEIDPVAVETINSPPYRGDLAKIAELSRTYPTHIGFSSDQDLAILALASERSADGAPALWGLEQSQGMARYLEELERLAPSPAVKAQTTALLDLARARDRRETFGAFVHDDPQILPKVLALQSAFAAKPGSRADYLLRHMVGSLEIYAFNRRAGEGERVGLYNNTFREALFKQNFLDNYRRADTGGAPPKAMLKFGGWHMYHGKSPGQAFTIGNFAHEYAVANGSHAYGLYVIALGGHTATMADLPTWLKPLLPKDLPPTPVVVDLRALQRFVRPLERQVAVADQADLRDLLMGFDAIVILPASRKATWDLTGFPPP